ncbi:MULTISPECIES: FadR/GntR family transcriptional regulator [Streptomyces]|jgi:Transcriptional regulators|uniref:FCD domain-containing protein n=1 Tax=Streptomyces mirabilis TaxID=68239 RepID=A0ABU3V2R0_9ACTN|nr:MULTISPECIES: FCD domain-containing protein [Streptomyces]MCX4615190.1 FCD domain-containing protein [Streptomyces mirabilis]MCX5356518.1 FCD domain-containing protein [Streptomyces mirabilis]MDU9000468.1 FCD domain-containing protein [Streptomyces mirabilis]QDN75339.1 FadR family transcriptional regulator [Streptomyces sp. S1A1-7]QDN84949.1 FadR family transcriptional regulator [Streptomyces sp. RLB3-6]
MNDTPAAQPALPTQARPVVAAAVNGAGERRDYRPGYEVVAERILEFIAESRLVAGDRLPTENDLAQRLDTSRAVVREAVKILSALGRVRAHKGRGLFVADDEGMLITSRWGGFFRPVDLDHVLMLFEFRRVQEMAASSLAATRATPAELRTIEVAMQQCRHGFVNGQVEVFNEADEDFHMGVAVASHNTFLVSAVRDARRLQRQSSAIGIHDTLGEGTESAVVEHEVIYRAIRDGRPDEAAEATATHLDRTLEDYRREIQRRLFG